MDENLIYIPESHGILPSECQCGGFLDFANKEELQCRVCKTLYNIDSLLAEIDNKLVCPSCECMNPPNQLSCISCDRRLR